jgi:hypothetical protein
MSLNFKIDDVIATIPGANKNFCDLQISINLNFAKITPLSHAFQTNIRFSYLYALDTVWQIKLLQEKTRNPTSYKISWFHFLSINSFNCCT